MNKRMLGGVAGLSAILMIGGAAMAADKPVAASAAPELADRFESLAYTTVPDRNAVAPLWREAAALARAAGRLNPKEPRYLRLEFEACMAGGDTSGAIAALNAYLTILPADEYGQVKLIDLYVSRMQTADSILSYLRNVVAKTLLPAPVRSHAAFVCAQTLMDRSQRDQALKMLNTALAIEPINYDALRLKYSLSGEEGASRRVGLLLAMLRSDPLDPQAAMTLAQELSDQGLPDMAAIWYVRAADLYNMTTLPRPPELARGGATEFYLCEHGPDAARFIESYLDAVPSDAQAWNIRLAIVRDLGPKAGDYDLLVHQAVIELTNRFQAVRSHMGAGDASTQPSVAVSMNPASTQPTTQPVAELPDLSGDMALLVKANQPQLTAAYLANAADVAWLRIYFLRDAGAGTQRLLDALGRLLPADDPLLARLNGWSYLVRGQWDQARQKLAAVANRDGFAQLGMVLLDDQAGDAAGGNALARSCLASHPSGATAAVLYSALHLRGAKVIPGNQAALCKTVVESYPRDWLDILFHPQAYFTVTAEPLEEKVDLMQAVLARVTIQNTSAFDITVGANGTLHPDMVFDANARGIIEKQMPAIAFDRMWQRLVLPAGKSMTQVVRLDRGELAKLLNGNPDVPISIELAVMINPMATQKGIVPGGAGGEIPFAEIQQRTSTPFTTDEDKKKVYDLVIHGTPAQRLRAVEALASIEKGVRDSANANPSTSAEVMEAANEILTHARPAATDADPAVKAWAEYQAALVASPDDLQGLVRTLTQSDDWYARLLGVIAAQRLSDQGSLVASVMSSDPEPAVKEYATAMTDYFAAAASRAATQPAAGQ